MFIPSRWQPSEVEKRRGEDIITENNYALDSRARQGLSSSMFATEAERFDSVAPFLLRNIMADRERRNYVIEPGGKAVPLSEAWQAPSSDFPTEQESFGHFSQPHERPLR